MRKWLVAAFSPVLLAVVALAVLTVSASSPNIALAANPSADLDQCANDPSPSPSSDGCNSSANQWVNGNLGASKASYFEGSSIPYRMRFDNLPLTSHTVIIEWDTTKSDKHAIDYLTTYNRTVANANPCLGVSGCNSATFTTFAIPADPQVTGAGVTPIAGNFTLYGGTITAVSAYSYPDGTGFAGDKSASITITFTASVANPVLAWGGHISDRRDWGMNNSAVAVPGSPYHMRLIDLDGSGGNQDRSLSADAVTFPGSITIIKDATPNGSTSFEFTASAPLSPTTFSLVDDGTSANTKLFDKIVTFQTYTVSENALPAGWTFGSANCSVTSPNGGSQNVSGQTATINLAEGENVTCTFNNQQQQAHLALVKTVTNDNGGTAVAGDWTLSASGPTPISGAGGVPSAVVLPGTYTLSESAGPSGYTAGSWSCTAGTLAGNSLVLTANQNATCTIVNNDNAPVLHLRKVVVNDNGGSAVATDWTLSASGPTLLSGKTPVDSGASFKAGTYALSEVGPTGYNASAWSCSGGSQSGSNITLGLGQEATCTITNDDIQPKLIVIKKVVNDNGGTKGPSDFTMSVTRNSVSLASFPGADTPGTTVAINAGSYTVSETGPSGYGSSYSTDCSGTIAVGETKTCTVTNDDLQPGLTVIKRVINDNGGTKTPADFSFQVNGGAVQAFNADGQNTLSVDAGTYAITEPAVAGYTTSYDNCSNVVIATGGSATCTITNDDVQPKLIVIKKVVNDNGGTKGPSDFTMSVTGNSPNPASFPGADAPGTTVVLNAGSYSVGETKPAGYGPTYSADCTGTIAVGETKTCTVTNDDLQPGLTVIKRVINDNGGTKTPADFSFQVNGGAAQAFNANGQNTLSVNAGTYTITEPAVAGYATTYDNCSNVVIATGGSATCTITNDDIATATPTPSPTPVTPTATPTPPPSGPESDLFCVQNSNGNWSLKSATKGTPEYNDIVSGPHQTPVNGQCPANPQPTPAPTNPPAPTATPVPPTPAPVPPTVAAAPQPPAVAAALPEPVPAPPGVMGEQPGPVPERLPNTGEADESGAFALWLTAGLLLISAGMAFSARLKPAPATSEK